MNRSLLSLASVAAMLAILSPSQAATLSVTSNLFIQLDGTDVTLVAGEVNNWNNQVSPVGVTNTFFAPAVANRPDFLTNQAMPNGSLHNLVDFRKSTSSTNSTILAQSDYLRGAASPAFDNLRTLTVFTVYNVDAIAPGNNTNATQREQVPFVSQHNTSTGNTTAWSHTFEDDTDSDTANGYQPAVMPQFRQGGSLNEVFTDSDFSSPIAPDTWYIVASRWNGTGLDVNGQPAFTTTSVVMTPGALPGTVESIMKSTTDPTLSAHEWSTHLDFFIGKNGSATSHRGAMDGQIAEILVYGDTLSAADFRSVTSYLRQKYFVPEPSSICLLAMGIVFGTVYFRRVK